MAVIKKSKTVQPTTINKFLGLNLSNTGDTQIALGESGNMKNFYITDDFKLRKMYGYKSFYEFTGKTVYGMFFTKVGGTAHMLISAGGKLYKVLQSDLDDEEDWEHLTMTEIGGISTVNACFFEFDNYVYILAGDYYKWDGTNCVQVSGYVPTVFINTPPAGGGDIYDEINMLTPKKKQEFNGDGTSTVYQLSEKAVDSVLSVKVGGVSKTATTDYTVNTTDGTVTFTAGNIPPVGYNNVVITWSKNTNTRNVITSMKYATVFGGDVDTRVFLYGNSSCKNRTYFSATTMVGDIAVPSVEYFPATAFVDVGPSNFTLTDLTRQYDRLLATTNKPDAYYLTISTEQLSVTLGGGGTATRYVPSVSTFPMNGAHGNIAPGQGQLINNYPVTFEPGSIIMWKATNVRDEKNMEEISQKIKLDLDDIPMNLVKTLDLQEKNQLWVSYDNKVWIYNYNNKTFSRLFLPDSVDNIASSNGNVYISTTTGKVAKFSDNFTDYDGETIDAYWEMNFADFGVPYLRKTMNRLWVLMQPQNWSSADVSFVSNLAESLVSKHIQYKKQWFDNVDFSDWHFTASVNPQPFKLKLKAKKFTNLKITIENTENSACTILALVLQVESFGYSK